MRFVSPKQFNFIQSDHNYDGEFSLVFCFFFLPILDWDTLTMRNGLVCIRTVSVNGISGLSAIGTPFRVNVCNIDQ